ncbi:MAG TPA: hypothetical protein DHU96_25070 [Actinobacteria bacterium]|nr:hypothetical protein [Actinomycetota bacterium]
MLWSAGVLTWDGRWVMRERKRGDGPDAAILVARTRGHTPMAADQAPRSARWRRHLLMLTAFWSRRPTPWLVRRVFPVLATAGLIVVAMVSSTWLGPHLAGKSAWALPRDLWGTLVAADRLLHLDLGGLYTRPTQLVTFPGAAVILVPVVAVADAAGLSLQLPGPQYAYPSVWLLAGPYEIAISAVVLFAADAIACRLGVTWPKRALLAAASATALWSVAARWGHPEDAVAVGLFLYAILALADSHTSRAAWLTGAAVAIQPLVLLALPIALAVIEPRRWAGFLARAAAPGVVVLGAAAAANWKATYAAVTSQPNSPIVNHPTVWTGLAPHLSDGSVVSGPARALAILAACGCALAAGRRWRAVRQAGEWNPQALEEVLWWTAVALAVRSVFEPVMVAYYLWPTLAVALIAASRSWSRLAATSIATAVLTFASQAPWQGLLNWWAPMMAGLVLTLFLARVPLRRKAAGSSQA